MLSMRKYLFSAGFALLVAATSVSVTMMAPPAFAVEIKYVVNNIPITSNLNFNTGFTVSNAVLTAVTPGDQFRVRATFVP